MSRSILAALVFACAATSAAAQGTSSEEITRRAMERRAVEAVIWGLPAVNTDLMLQQMLTKTAGKVNQFIYWGRPLDYRNQTLTPNPAQLYLIAIRDKDGNAFDGAKTYRLKVPPSPPVEQYWSVTAYDRQTHALIKGLARASRSSQIPEMQRNPDGSMDVYFGPKAPTGKESNWVPTDPQRGFELMFRVYGPKQEFFQKAWVLPDAEEVWK